jgi:DNA-binding MarR family transcriptional regulator
METPDPSDSLERIVIGAVGLTTRALAEAAPGVDLSFPQWRAILVLGESRDGARVGEVAARVGVTLPATSRLLHRLERRNLVTLATDDADRRATRARLTQHGHDVRSAILEYRRAGVREVAAALDGRGGESVADAIETIARAFERFA